jgi:hypothetical protein
MAEKWLTIKQAAELSGYHPEYVRQLVYAGRVKARKFTFVWQVSHIDLQRYVQQVGKRGEKRGPKRGPRKSVV